MEYSEAAYPTLQREESILDNEKFRRLAIARALAQAAQNAVVYALLIIVVEETTSGVLSSLLILSIIIPSVATGLFSGALADRLPKKLMIVSADLLRMTIAIVFFAWADSIWKIYAVVMAFAAAGELRGPAESAVVPRLVHFRQLAAANAVLSMALIAGQVLGMAILAPLFLKTFGPDPLYLTCATLFFASAMVVAFVPNLEPSSKEQDDASTPGVNNLGYAVTTQLEPASVTAAPLTGMGKHARAAWTILQNDPVSHMVVLQLVLVTTAMLTLTTLISPFMREVLDVEAENAIFVFAPAALGLFGGLRLGPLFARGQGNAAVVSFGFLMFLALLPLLGFVPELGAIVVENTPFGSQASRVLVAAFLAAPMGFAYSLTGVSARAVLHERAPAAMRGRIFAVVGVITSVTSIVPLVVAGAFADLFGIRAVVLLVSITSLAIGFYGYVWRILVKPALKEAPK